MIKKVENQSEAEHSAFAHSRKIYVKGDSVDVRVPMREISLSPSNLPGGGTEENEAVRVYDTSGAWGDPGFHKDPSPWPDTCMEMSGTGAKTSQDS